MAKGRTNHYWFDLNRDWLPVQHPESVARVTQFQRWRPHVLTDHHEMGKDRTFFFQPGVVTRQNPLTDPENFRVTGLIAEFHAKALDKLGTSITPKKALMTFTMAKALPIQMLKVLSGSCSNKPASEVTPNKQFMVYARFPKR